MLTKATMKFKLGISFFLLLSGGLLYSCNQSNIPKDNYTSGHIRISVDESLQPMMEKEMAVFSTFYKDAKIDVNYKSETEAINDLLKDSTRFIITTRPLNERDAAFFTKNKLTVVTDKIAKDGIALIVNKKNQDSTLTKEQMEGVFTGKIKKWNEINPSYPKEDIQIVFDHPGSSTLMFIMNYYKLNKDALPSNFFALKSNPEVIKYVQSHKNALGLIGRAWIDDQDTATQNLLLNGITAMQLAPPDSAKGDLAFYDPQPGYFAGNNYPFTRPVYVISWESYNGLNKGLRFFMSGKQGQTILLRMGLLPVSLPIRLMKVTD